MLRSMTAYGRAEARTKRGFYSIEIHTINRKHLDVQIDLPPDMVALDVVLRKKLASVVGRGRVSIKIEREGARGKLVAVEPLFLKKLYKECEALAEGLKYASRGDIPFSFLLELALSGKFSEESLDEEGRGALLQGFEVALQRLIAMKESEGALLLEDFQGRIEKSREQVEQIEEFQLLSVSDEDRIMREVVFASQRVDISEELVRLRSHLAQFQETVLSKEQMQGRKLEFLVQEMQREMTTILSKSEDVEIAKSALFVKIELDRMREQIQNIE